MLILQHRRERFHPFNTARIVREALRNAGLVVVHPRKPPADLSFSPRAGLLYPGAEAVLLSDVPIERRPEQLVILDGTWHHTKTMLRDIPALGRLPRYRLAPASPSRYAIRREPFASFISTIEATVAALGVLEPETPGLDRLMDVFLSMVNRQLEHPKSAAGRRVRLRPKRTFKNVPRQVVGDLDTVVVAYGESASREVGNERAPRPPIVWVAERLGTGIPGTTGTPEETGIPGQHGERFGRLIQPRVPLGDSHLAHLELSRGDFSEAVTLEEARRAWKAFLRPSDVIAVYNSPVRRLAVELGGEAPKCVVLKAVDLHGAQQRRTLEELLAAEGIRPAAALHPGRAGKRLADLAALVRHLHALANNSTAV